MEYFENPRIGVVVFSNYMNLYINDFSVKGIPRHKLSYVASLFYHFTEERLIEINSGKIYNELTMPGEKFEIERLKKKYSDYENTGKPERLNVSLNEAGQRPMTLSVDEHPCRKKVTVEFMNGFNCSRITIGRLNCQKIVDSIGSALQSENKNVKQGWGGANGWHLDDAGEDVMSSAEILCRMVLGSR